MKNEYEAALEAISQQGFESAIDPAVMHIKGITKADYDTIRRALELARDGGWRSDEPPQDGTIIYGVSYGPCKFTHYKKSSQERKNGKIGRWQEMNEYGGWNNATKPDQWITKERFDEFQALRQNGGAE